MAEQFHHEQQLKNPKYRNWVKAGLGLKYLKDGLQIFSDEKVKQQHDNIVNDVKRRYNLTTVNCGQCILENLQPDHVRNKNNECPLGYKGCNCQYPGGKNACPNNVCGAIYHQIILNHNSNPPAPFWKNTCVQKWCTDQWEVAKCYINAPGYASKSNASEIDCTGLLHLFINSKFLQTKLVCKITGRDVFSKTRSARNTIFHSTAMEMDDVEFIQYIDDMIAILEDGKELLNRPESIAAVAMLNELKNSRFVISTLNEAEVVREAMAVIDSKESKLKETVEAATNEILLSKTDTVQSIQSAGEEFNLKSKQNLDMIEKSRNDIINDIEIEAKKVRDQIKADAHAAVTSTSQRIVEMEEQVTYAKKEIVEVLRHGKLTYLKSKEAFRRSLIEMYVENVVNISPILLQPERCDVRIDQVYIDPLIKILPKNENENFARIQSYQQIFRKDGKQQNLIYLIGEAGSGKSTFCINMINNWCIAHSDNKAEDSINIQEMKRYKFLFYLPLRHEDTYDDVEEMILSHYDDPVIITIFEQEPEACLILLDGLDEWILKTEPKTSFLQSKGLPRRNLNKGYTIITTSRPWKFESIGLKNTEIKIKLKLCGVDNLKSMADKTIGALNEMFHTEKNTYGFQNCLLNSKIDNEMKSVPIILQQLICLWFDDKLSCLGKSDIYSNMLWMFFEWTDLRSGNEDVLKGIRDKSSNIDISDLPDQLNCRELCPELIFVIKNIAHLAYATLLTTRKETSLIFDDLTFKNLNIHKEVIAYSLKSGIISKQRAVGLSLSRRQHLSFSFVHKSMQEFLCALHIYTEFKRSAPHLFEPFLLQTIDKNLKSFKKYFENCKTTIDILDLSNVFMFLCGFDTYLAAYISKFVYNIVLKDEAIINYRTSISYRPFEPDKRSILTTVECLEGHKEYALDIQNILFSFIKEANLHDEKPRRLFFLSDFVYLPLFTTDVESTKYINPAMILSLNIDISGPPLPPLIFEFLRDPFLSRKMSTLKLQVSNSSIYDLQLDTTLQNIIKRSRNFLTCLSFKGKGATHMFFPTTMRSVTKLLISVLPIMYRLKTIKLENIGLTFREIMELSNWLSNAKYLRQISLRKISDNPNFLPYPDSPNIDLSQHPELQVLDHDFDTIELTEFSVQNLETCYFYLRNNFISKSVSTVLKRSKKLKCLYLTGEWLYLHKKKVTKIIQNLLSNLIDLKQLHLEKFYFGEIILVDPMKMLNLREITLKEIDMSAGSWNRLLESVLRLPQNVNVCIQYSSEECLSRYILQEGKYPLHNLKSGYSYVVFSTKPFDP